MTSFRGKVAFITGGSSGIGLELGRQLLAAGAKVALVARREESMRSFIASLPEDHKANALALHCDVTDDESVRAAVATTIENFGGIDLVFANAGFAVVGKVQSLELTDYQRQFDTNVWGVLRTLYASLDALKKSRGAFVISGSVSGHMALRRTSAYSMSKFAIRGFAECIEADLAAVGVRVVHLSCGFIASEIAQKDNHGKMRENSPSSVPQPLVVPVDKAARNILQAVLTKTGDVVITGHGKVFVTANRLFPSLNRILEKLFKI